MAAVPFRYLPYVSMLNFFGASMLSWLFSPPSILERLRVIKEIQAGLLQRWGPVSVA